MEKYKKISIILSTMLASFLTPFILSSINIALPYIATEFSLNPNEMVWLSISFLISSTTMVIPIGKIADKYGRVKIFKAGFIIFSILSLLCGISLNKEQLILFRFLQGIGAGMIFSTAVAIISSAFQKGERGKYIGFSASSVYAGLTLGPFAGGIITEHLGWRGIFYIIFSISIPIIFLLQKNIKAEWKSENIKINKKMMLFYMLTIFLLTYSSSNMIKNKFIFIVSAILFFSYIIIELKTRKKFIDIKEIISNKMFLFSNLSAFFHYSATFSITFLLSLYFQYIKNMSPQNTGLILSVMPLFMMGLSPITGKLSDKKNPAHFTSSGIILSIIGITFLLFIDKINTSFIIISLSIIGIGFALFTSPNTNQAISSLHNSFYSTGSAILSTMRIMGQNISMSIINTIFYFYLPGKNIIAASQNFLKTFTLSLYISIALLFISLYFSLKKYRNTLT